MSGGASDDRRSRSGSSPSSPLLFALAATDRRPSGVVALGAAAVRTRELRLLLMTEMLRERRHAARASMALDAGGSERKGEERGEDSIEEVEREGGKREREEGVCDAGR